MVWIFNMERPQKSWSWRPFQ